MLTLLLSGLRRSGNHLIQKWLCEHFESAVVCNNMKDLQDGSFRRSTQTFLWKNGIDQGRGRMDDPQFLLLGYEDKQPDRTKADWLEFIGRKYVENGFRTHLLRDFYNLSASRLAKPRKIVQNFNDDLPNRWLEYAREPSLIFYNDFVESEHYRAGLAESLGLGPRLVPEDMTFVPSFGGGSSFNGGDVMNRWQQVDYPQEWLDNEEVREMNFKLFGWTVRKDGTKC